MNRSGLKIGWNPFSSYRAVMQVGQATGPDWSPLVVAIFALVLLSFTRSVAPWGTSAFLLLAACALSYQIAGRWLGDPVLLWIVLSNLALRSVLSLAFYLASLWNLPILTSLQLGEGFWTFAPDAPHHHAYAIQIVEAWGDDIELPDGLHRGWYFLILATVYKLMGIHPLHGVFLNAWIGAASGLLVYSTARRIGGTGAGRVAALFVAFWPSLLLWSTQLLKEQITAFFVLLAFHFTVGICHEMTSLVRQNRILVRHLLLLSGATGTVFLIATARPLYSLALALSGLLIFGAWALRAFYNRQVCGGGFLLFTAISMVGAAFVGGLIIDPLYYFSPRTPWVGHYARGIRHLERGDPRSAEKEFQRSVELNSGFIPARERLPALLLSGRGEQHERPSAPTEPSVSAGTPADVTAGKPIVSRMQTLKAAILDFSVLLIEFPATISSLRAGQLTAAGHSPIYPEADLSSFPKIFAYFPKGLLITLLAPFPWQAFHNEGVAGMLKSFSLVEMFFIGLLIPFGLNGSWRLIRSGYASGWFLVMYLFIGSSVLALSMVGLGNLFRYRVHFLLALIILANSGGLPEVLQRVKASLRSYLG